MIILENIKKEFNGKLIIDDISLSIKPGEVIAVMGASGSGKTTLLKILAGLEQADSGLVTSHNNITYYKSMIAQKPALLPWLSVKENVAYGLKLQGTITKEQSNLVYDYLLTTQLSQYADSLPQDLSGGMQQRVALLAALITEPDLLLMDEPLSALDTQTKAGVRDFMRNILVSKNQTTIMVTHDPEEALYLADRIIILSPKPAHIIDHIEVPFGSNRYKGLIFSEEFQEMKKYISYIMYAESIRVMTDTQIGAHKHLSIGSNIWVGTLPLYLASNIGLYEKNGISSHNLLTFEWSAHDRLMPLKEGLVDVLNMTLETAIIACESNPDIRILAPIDVSTGGDALVVRPEINSVKNLTKKRIAVERAWISEFYLHYILQKHGMNVNDVEVVHMDSKDTPKALLSGTVDAIITQEPWLSEIMSFQKYKILESTQDDEIIYAVLVTTQQVIDEKSDVLKGLTHAIQESILLIQQDTKKSVSSVSHMYGLSNTTIINQLNGLKFITQDQYASVKNNINVIETILLSSNMIQKPFDRSKILF